MLREWVEGQTDRVTYLPTSWKEGEMGRRRRRGGEEERDKGGRVTRAGDPRDQLMLVLSFILFIHSFLLRLRRSSSPPIMTVVVGRSRDLPKRYLRAPRSLPFLF
jgi:hypothetical protein